MAESPEQLVRIVVADHPDLDQAVRLEAMPEELAALGKLAIKEPVILDVTSEGEEPERYVLTRPNFDKLATDRPMAEVLADAKPVDPKPQKRTSHNRTASGDPLVNYNSPESAGMPHKGKIGTDEAVFVRDNLELVNERRLAAGYPPIDPANAGDVKRYGFEGAADRGADEG
jgi:hypothetical protein